jgi:hypothetical protein
MPFFSVLFGNPNLSAAAAAVLCAHTIQIKMYFRLESNS